MEGMAAVDMVSEPTAAAAVAVVIDLANRRPAYAVNGLVVGQQRSDPEHRCLRLLDALVHP
jgi:hypothetical protein